MEELIINIPIDVDTNEKKLGYFFGLQQENIKLFNVMGQWYRDGLTLTQYNQLPTRVKEEYEYSFKLTKVQFEDYRDTFKFGYRKVASKILTEKDILQDHFIKNNPMGADLERDISSAI